MPATELTLSGLVAGYDGTTVLEGIDLSVKRGERVGIIGRNGAGKTTTLASALGLTQRLSGHVLIDGRDVSNVPTPERVRLGIGLVPQTRDIFPSLTVEDNLRCGLQGGPVARLRDAYRMFPRLEERRANFGNQLSGGEQQMLSIARALMAEPSILLLDEPLEGLSPLVAHEVMQAVQKLVADRGLGCVLVEQHVALVLDFVDRVMVLERGRSMFYGTPAELVAQPHILESCIGLRKAA